MINFLWRAVHNAVASREKSFWESPVCPVCDWRVESIEHILFHCKFALVVWRKCSLGSFIKGGGELDQLENG